MCSHAQAGRIVDSSNVFVGQPSLWGHTVCRLSRSARKVKSEDRKTCGKKAPTVQIGLLPSRTANRLKRISMTRFKDRNTIDLKEWILHPFEFG